MPVALHDCRSDGSFQSDEKARRMAGLVASAVSLCGLKTCQSAPPNNPIPQLNA